MWHRLILGGLLSAVAVAGVALTDPVHAVGYAESRAKGAAVEVRPRQAGVLPVRPGTEIGYDLGLGGPTAVHGNVTTLHQLSKTDMLNLRLEPEGGRAFWLRREGGQEQRAGLFSADIGGAGGRRVLGWQFSRGYAAAGDGLPRGSGTPWWSAMSKAAAGAQDVQPEPPGLGPFPYAPLKDEFGNRARSAFAREQAKVRQMFAPAPLLPGGRSDFRLAAGGAAETHGPFVGGELRQGLTPGWTVEAGGYADEAASIYARTRARLGAGLFKLEARNDDKARSGSQRAAYVFRNTALTAEHRESGFVVGSRLQGRGYYAAFDHGFGDADSRFSAGYATQLRSSRVAVHCEARQGSEDSHYCGVGLQIPLQSGVRRTAAAPAGFGASGPFGGSMH